MELNKEQIEKINDSLPYISGMDQGIFTEPYGIPYHIKEPVIYCRYETGGYSGGSCWDDSDPRPYSSDAPKDKMKVLDLVLAELYPRISYLEFKEIQALVHTNSETEFEYYGNSTDWEIEYIVLSELIDLLEHFERVNNV